MTTTNNKWPIGQIIEIIKMDDPQAPPPHTRGVIQSIDGIGQIHVKWDNGSSLAVQPYDDVYRILDEPKK
jgi:hypothetical protein